MTACEGTVHGNKIWVSVVSIGVKSTTVIVFEPVTYFSSHNKANQLACQDKIPFVDYMAQ